LSPALSGLRYRTFLFFNVLGGVLWGVGFTLLGFIVGRSFSKTLSDFSAAVLLVLGCAIMLILGKKLLQRRRRAHSEDGNN
jgi:membrane-associated protein